VRRGFARQILDVARAFLQEIRDAELGGDIDALGGPIAANELTELLLGCCHNESTSMLAPRSSLAADLELEGAFGAEVVDQVPVVSTLSIRILREIEHGFRLIEGQHSIRDDCGLQVSDPSMQLRKGPSLGMLFDVVAHPQ
jgi:hypothetical protein